MTDEKEPKYSMGLFNDYKEACYIIYVTEKGRKDGEVSRIHGQDAATKTKAQEVLDIMNQVKRINVRKDIPSQFLRGYVAREADFTKKETELFYSYDDNDKCKELIREIVLFKRDVFYELWLHESNTQHFQDEEDFENSFKVKPIWTRIKDYFDLRK